MRAEDGSVKDEESGEVVHHEIVSLRRDPLVVKKVSRHRRDRGIFRVRDALLQADLRSSLGYDIQGRITNDLHHVFCAHCNYSNPQAVWSEFTNSEERKRLEQRSLFRIPAKYLPGVKSDEAVKEPDVITVSIWQEFIQGMSVLEQYRSAEEKSERSLYGTIMHYLNEMLPVRCVVFISWFFFLLTYFGVCCTLTFGIACMVKFMTHLEIHQQAYDSKLNVIFNGSPFQGPCYILLRWHCEHCIQKEREKVVHNLMKKMKSDILGSSSPT